jgi:2-polyprenyl-6-methoxyphenol hydroxylase-like FAD-dependent oxidoreductase
VTRRRPSGFGGASARPSGFGGASARPSGFGAAGRALIVGGGIGGLCAAIALRRAGLDVTVYEQASEIKEVGAGSSLWANAIRALDRLGLGDAVRDLSVPYEVGGLRASDGTALTTVSAEELVRLFGIPVIVMHRADLLAVLLAAVPKDCLRLGGRVRSIRQDDRSVTVELSDGSAESGDLLVGADGLTSVCRAALHGDERPRYAGCTAWRAVVPFDKRAVKATETWGGGRVFGQVPISNGRVYWYAAQNVAQGGSSPQPKRELLELFAGWHAPIEALIDAAAETAILRNDLFDRPGLKRWGQGRVTLLGDAAHPMTPFLGQGACQAIEDAVVLGECMSAERDPVVALRDYERRRIPRANAFVNRSHVVGQIARLENRMLIALRNALLKRISPTFQARQIASMIAST